MDILKKFKSTIKKYDLINPGDKILVAVSGGPDSIALLCVLNSLKEELGLTLCVAHLNHKLRREAKKDLLFVKRISERMNLSFIDGEVDIAKLAKVGSVEEVAREERFKFLFKVAKRFKTDKIALGHTKDDQAETVLMRILRGTGLYGLRGIIPKRQINGFTIIRPFIEIERDEINVLLKKLKIKPRLDRTNLEDIYFRNKIRNKLIPLLKNYNKNIKEILSDMAENIGSDYDYLFDVASLALGEVGLKNSSSIFKINLKKFLKLHPSIQRMVIRIAINDIAGNTRRLSFQHWKEIADLIFNRPSNSVVNLPSQINVIKEKDRIIISLRKA